MPTMFKCPACGQNHPATRIAMDPQARIIGEEGPGTPRVPETCAVKNEKVNVAVTRFFHTDFKMN